MYLKSEHFSSMCSLKFTYVKLNWKNLVNNWIILIYNLKLKIWRWFEFNFVYFCVQMCQRWLRRRWSRACRTRWCSSSEATCPRAATRTASRSCCCGWHRSRRSRPSSSRRFSSRASSAVSKSTASSPTSSRWKTSSSMDTSQVKQHNCTFIIKLNKSLKFGTKSKPSRLGKFYYKSDQMIIQNLFCL